MNALNHIIIINNEDKTSQVEHIRPDGYAYSIKFHNTDKIYSYSRDKILWLSNPTPINIENCHILVNGKMGLNIKGVNFFFQNEIKYYAITYANDFTQHYPESQVDIHRSCLTGLTTSLFEYMHMCATINTLGANEENGNTAGILSSIYSKIDFVDESTVAAIYLDPGRGIKKSHIETPIFPFGCNASQAKAVRTALANQISVIQGPPGTGKTQTILNIVANLLKNKKSVLIVSNNNSATENVSEKLSKNDLGFLVAPLGNRENKEAFIANQPPLNPKLPSWRMTKIELFHANQEVKKCLEKVEAVFKMQEKLALCHQELTEAEVELSHYEQEHATKLSNRGDIKAKSSAILKIIGQLKAYAINSRNDTKNLLERFKLHFNKLSLELRLRFGLNIKDRLTQGRILDVIPLLDELFYICKIQELKTEINNLTGHLSQLDAKALMKSLTDNSMAIIKSSIAKRYKEERQTISSVKDLFNNGESVLADYPIVLSTTFSSKTCFNSDTLFDYVIMDEASQVSVETGLLALTCAKNAVIVGDTMQLPNVITEDVRIKLDEIRKSYNIPDSYDAGRQSFLSSVLAAIPKVPETLLREHYRCHPDIINFCNQKFYGGNLLIMTNRQDDEKHLFAITTAPGKHCRGHYNQREIDTVKMELLPMLDNTEDTGIIAPYNQQVSQFNAQIPEIEAATVHKYQGREKDTIIMSVTDDAITEFADNANLLNVAVSRAKNKFCMVVTSNPQELNGNIHDLLEYIKYQQGVIVQSKLHSIFDYLFSQIEEYNRENKLVSEYDSENLTFQYFVKI